MNSMTDVLSDSKRKVEQYSLLWYTMVQISLSLDFYRLMNTNIQKWTYFSNNPLKCVPNTKTSI